LPTLLRLSVSYRPESRLRHWCSSTSLRISPLHVEFHSPLLYSSLPVSNDRSWLSHEISHQTWKAACAPFTPNNSGQRSPPTYYRGCWHVVSRGFLVRYRQGVNVFGSPLCFPHNRVLRSDDLHHSRAVAPSGFRPLRKIPYCCLPKDSGPCLGHSVADHTRRSATHRCLGELLSHQLANATRAHLLATARRAVFHFFFRRRRILFGISTSFPVLSRTIRQVAHVLLTHPPLIPQTSTRRLLSASCARLAC